MNIGKNIFILLLLVVCSAVPAFSNEYYINTGDKCSVQNDCSDILQKSIRKNTSFSESDLMMLKEQATQTNVNPVKIYNVPESVFSYPSGHIYSRSSFEISNADPKSGEPGVSDYYPGHRGNNQLIIYTPSFGLRTGTNEFGAEAVVLDNVVVKLSGADSFIPKNGFVISGHGKAKTWIHDNVVLGSKIFINPELERITAVITSDTYIYEAGEQLKEAYNLLKYYRMTDKCFDYKRASTSMLRASDLLEKAEKNPEKTFQYITRAKTEINKAVENLIPYKADEFKGIWIRPSEKSPREIEKTVEEIKKAGIDNVFLETFYHGKTIYPSEVLEKYGVTSQRGEFNSFDPLKVWIEECHKQNIKLHVWFECFYVGNVPPYSSTKHILSVYPSWANTTKEFAETNEFARSRAEHNGYFIDPANPEVQKFILDVLSEIIDKYQPDGINLDYIRYPQCALKKNNSLIGTEWGYTKYARNEYKNKYGSDPLFLTGQDYYLRNKWFEYRQNKITDIVIAAREMTKDKQIMLTAVIFPDRTRSAETKMQDWKTWSDKNLVDAFTPLLLTNDKKTASSLVRDIKICTNPPVKIYPGLFVMFMGGSFSDLLLQIQEMRKLRTEGVVLFDYAHLSPEYINALSTRIFNKKY